MSRRHLVVTVALVSAVPLLAASAAPAEGRPSAHRRDPAATRTGHGAWLSTRFYDRAIDAQAAAARRAIGTESNALWQKVYERSEAEAPAVPLVNRRIVDLAASVPYVQQRFLIFVSKRVGNVNGLDPGPLLTASDLSL